MSLFLLTHGVVVNIYHYSITYTSVGNVTHFSIYLV